MTVPIPGTSSPTAKPRTKKQKRAKAVESTAAGGAGAVGSVFGAAKLRDTYQAESPEHAARFRRAVTNAGARAMQRGHDVGRVSRVASAVEHGHPGFKPLAAATALGATAAGAHRYQEIEHWARNRKQSLEKGTDVDTPTCNGIIVEKSARVAAGATLVPVDVVAKENSVATDAFGVQVIAKDNTNPKYASPERLATGAVFPGVHGAVAGKPGKKVRAAAHEVAGAAAGSLVPGPGTVAGAAAGTAVAHKKGLYKPDKGSQRNGPVLGDKKDDDDTMSKSVRTDAFGVVVIGKALSDKNGNVLQRPTDKNSRRQNTAVGAGVGGAEGGTVIGGLAAAAGRNRAKAGVKSLHAIGAGPSKMRGARIVGGHAAKVGGKGALAGAAVGGAYGALLGASTKAKKGKQPSWGRKAPKAS